MMLEVKLIDEVPVRLVGQYLPRQRDLPSPEGGAATGPSALRADCIGRLEGVHQGMPPPDASRTMAGTFNELVSEIVPLQYYMCSRQSTP